MQSIVPPSPDTQDDDAWKLPESFWTTTPRALEAEVVYEGIFPERSRDYYALTAQGYRLGYVYILSSFVPIYIGKSWRPGNRFDRHRRKPWWSEVENLTILCVRGEDRREADALMDGLETFAIRRLHPVYNIAKVAAPCG